MCQSGLFEDNFLDDWEASAGQSWDVTKKKFGDQFGILTRASNRKSKRSGFESTNSLRENPFSCIPLMPTPAPTQSSLECDALSEYATELEDQVEELQSVSGEDTVVDS